MKAHKVPATYYASWKIPGKNHSFYVFYKDKLYNEGQSKSYKEVDKITQEHSFFMEENFYYLDIKNVPGLTYKLQNEIEEFLRIVKFEKEGVTFTKLVTKDIDTIYHRYSHREKKYIYADLETGTVLKSYSYPEKDNESQDIELEKNITHKVGENLNILEEKDFSTYLLQQNNLKNIYTLK